MQLPLHVPSQGGDSAALSSRDADDRWCGVVRCCFGWAVFPLVPKGMPLFKDPEKVNFFIFFGRVVKAFRLAQADALWPLNGGSGISKSKFEELSNYGHTQLNPPHPVRSAQLNSWWQSQYYGGGPHGNTLCCNFCFFFLFFFFFPSQKTSTPTYIPLFRHVVPWENSLLQEGCSSISPLAQSRSPPVSGTISVAQRRC